MIYFNNFRAYYSSLINIYLSYYVYHYIVLYISLEKFYFFRAYHLYFLVSDSILNKNII